MAKLVAETGPLRDFTCPEQLMRYAGLNVCRKASGKYVGQSKISKKGRCLLRKILYQIAFSSLIGKGKIYGEFYQKKKKELKIYKKTMVCIMRKFLKMTLGVYKSPIAFDPKRIQICESKYKAVS